jgi:YHS domain-containing protein
MLVRALARIVVIAVVVAIGWLVGRLVRQSSAEHSSERRTPPSAAESMVRDRVCNTYLPRSRALVARAGGSEHFFCSDRCRRSFLVSRPTLS